MDIDTFVPSGRPGPGSIIEEERAGVERTPGRGTGGGGRVPAPSFLAPLLPTTLPRSLTNAGGSMSDAATLVHRYYDAFNAKDHEAMLACLAEEVEHRVNQGEVRRGKAAFAEFLAVMRRSYDERLEDLVILTEPTGARAAAEFTVQGVYRVRAEGLPPARGQRYTLPAGAFFTARGGAIERVSTYYNLADWLRQVGGGNAP
jgi:steroid delta-isomerase-like uncharacterized protein